ncbi:MAG TPA: hypothetical protein VIO94_15485 [Phenylobacterium sp.]
MFEPLLEADPTFEPAWRAFLSDWEGEADLPHYMALGDLARHLIDRLKCGDIEGFPAVFDVVEQWHRHGDHDVREAATVGLLESLQNTNLHSSTAPSEFEPWLGPETRRWWEKLHRFWSRGEIMKDD